MTTSDSRANILLIANRTCPCPDVLATVREQAGEGGHVHVVSPALNSRLRHYVSDIDGAVDAASGRLKEAISLLRALGADVTGEVGDSDPLLAARDALRTFEADGIVISTYPKGQSNWLERDLPGQVADEFGVPVTHLVSRYDLAATS